MRRPWPLCSTAPISMKPDDNDEDDDDDDDDNGVDIETRSRATADRSDRHEFWRATASVADNQETIRTRRSRGNFSIRMVVSWSLSSSSLLLFLFLFGGSSSSLSLLNSRFFFDAGENDPVIGSVSAIVVGRSVRCAVGVFLRFGVFGTKRGCCGPRFWGEGLRVSPEDGCLACHVVVVVSVMSFSCFDIMKHNRLNNTCIKKIRKARSGPRSFPSDICNPPGPYWTRSNNH